MNARHLTVLGVVALVAVVIAFYSTSLREPMEPGSVTEGMLMPGLKAAINDVSEVRIAKSGGETVATLVRGENQWTVSEQHGYAADTGKIRKLLLDLADARLREAKTSNPENYHYLGVSDIASPDAKGVQISFAGIDAGPVIIGKAATDAGDATYARQADASESWLVSGRIDVDKEALDWLNRDILDLPPTRIQSVTVRHPDGGQLRVSKADRSEMQFSIEQIPEGREPSSAAAANPMGSVLRGLKFDGVMLAAETELAEPVVTEYRLFDGMVVTAQSQVQDDNKALVKLRVSFDEALARQFVPSPEDFEQIGGAQDSETGDAAPSADAQELPSFTAAMEQAQALDARLSPWAYRIPAYKHQQMAQRMDALLKAVE